MRLGVVVRLLLGGVVAPGVYLLIWNVGFIASLLSGIRQPWQLVALVGSAAFAGAMAGLAMAWIWRSALGPTRLQYPRWLSRALVCSWTGLGLVPPFFPFPGKPACAVAAATTFLGLLAIGWHHHRASEVDVEP